jgi:exodeoxyribonuclease VII large subunit
VSPRKTPSRDASPARGGQGAGAPGLPIPASAPGLAAPSLAPGAAPAPAQPPPPLSVSALIGRVKGALQEAFPQSVCVVGQISGMKAHSSGHLYFRLKDAASALDAVMFRGAAMRLKFDPTDGLEVVAEGRMDVYETQGRLQFYVDRMTPKGQGSLELAFRQLVEKLQKELLFDPAHKLPLPRFPRAVGVVTSPTGAAVRDIRRTLARRWPAARMLLVPVLVQGEGAAAGIAEAIRRLDASAERYGIDTIILARGGGSLEDLWAFNEEAVARAIYACRTPLVTGVGHEVDVTVADMVADVRAPTPTGAAELAVPDRADVNRQVGELQGRLARTLRERLRAARAELEAELRSSVFRDPLHRVHSSAQQLDEWQARLRSGLVHRVSGLRSRLEPAANRLAALHPARLHERACADLTDLTHRLAWALGGRSKRCGDQLAAVAGRLLAAHPGGRLKLVRQQVEAAERQLEAMSYRGVLKRGFSLTRGAEGRIVRSVLDVREGEQIHTEVRDGSIASRVGDGGGADGGGGTASAPGGGPARSPGPKTSRKGKPPPSGPSLFDAQEPPQEHK